MNSQQLVYEFEVLPLELQKQVVDLCVYFEKTTAKASDEKKNGG